MKNIIILALLSFSLLSMGYAYNINFDAYAHEKVSQPKIESLFLSATDEKYYSLNKETLILLVKSLADHINPLRSNSNLRISELKNLVVILLIALSFNVVFLSCWLYQRLKSKA